MKLEIKHLAPYLPFELKWQVINKGSFTTSPDTIEIATMTISNIASLLSIKKYGRVSCKPILRPLSDLTKEIEIDGKKFVPVDYNAFKDNRDHLIQYANGFAHFKSVKYGIIERLFEWHFDVFGLIPQGLALPLI